MPETLFTFLSSRSKKCGGPHLLSPTPRSSGLGSSTRPQAVYKPPKDAHLQKEAVKLKTTMHRHTCDHVAWLHVSRRGLNSSVLYQGRYASIASQLPDPETQTPSLTLLLGKKLKDQALRYLFSHNNIRRTSISGSPNLRIENSSLNSKHPLLFADCDPLLPECVQAHEQARNCHPTTNFPIKWPSSSTSQVSSATIARLLFPFSDVVCVFATDCGGLATVRARLSQWAAAAALRESDHNLRPYLVVIFDHGDKPENALQYLLQRHTGTDLHTCFKEITVLELAPQDLSPSARFLRLREEINYLIERSREDRVAAYLLFTANHQASLFERALIHFTSEHTKPLDLMRASQYRNEVTSSHSSHVENFLRLAEQHNTPLEKYSSLIASATLMNAYPPGMHGKFQS